MNEAQQKFLKTQSAVLEKYMNEAVKDETNPKKLNDHWADVAGFIAVVVKACTGHEHEAREALWDVTDKWEAIRNANAQV